MRSMGMSPMRSETKAAIFRSPRRYSVRTLSAATVAEDYTITQADKDKLRTYSIVFKAATPAP